MDLAQLKRHLPSIEDGRWVGADEVPGLADVRVKVRGASSTAGQDFFAAKLRNVEPRDRKADGSIRPEVMQRLLLDVTAEWSLIEVEGLTLGDKPVGVEEARKLIVRPEFQPFADLVMQAIAAVDSTREARAEALAKN